MVEIYVKGIADREQFDARHKLIEPYNVSGVEVMLFPLEIEDLTTREKVVDALKYGVDKFEGKINIEIGTAFGKGYELDLFSDFMGDRSKKILDIVLGIHSSLKLEGMISFHPIANNHREYPFDQGIYELKRDLVAAQRLGGFLSHLSSESGKQILVENAYPHISKDLRLTYSEIGMFPSDFGREGINLPMTFDTAHIGILMSYYAIADATGVASILADKMRLKMPSEGVPWGESIREKGYTETLKDIIESNLKRLKVINVHFVNAGLGFNREADHCTSLDVRGGLFDLKEILKAVLKFRPKYIVPEIDENMESEYLTLSNTRRLLELINQNMES